MSGLTAAERAELRRAAAGRTTNLIIPATWANGLLDALDAAERQRNAARARADFSDEQDDLYWGQLIDLLELNGDSEPPEVIEEVRELTEAVRELTKANRD